MAAIYPGIFFFRGEGNYPSGFVACKLAGLHLGSLASDEVIHHDQVHPVPLQEILANQGLCNTMIASFDITTDRSPSGVG